MTDLNNAGSIPGAIKNTLWKKRLNLKYKKCFVAND